MIFNWLGHCFSSSLSKKGQKNLRSSARSSSVHHHHHHHHHHHSRPPVLGQYSACAPVRFTVSSRTWRRLGSPAGLVLQATAPPPPRAAPNTPRTPPSWTSGPVPGSRSSTDWSENSANTSNGSMTISVRSRSTRPRTSSSPCSVSKINASCTDTVYIEPCIKGESAFLLLHCMCFFLSRASVCVEQWMGVFAGSTLSCLHCYYSCASFMTC